MPAISLQRLRKALLSEFLAGIVERFSESVGVNRQRVPGTEWTLFSDAFPLWEHPEHSACRVEPFQTAILPEQESTEMPAICISQTPHSVVILGKEQCGV